MLLREDCCPFNGVTSLLSDMCKVFWWQGPSPPWSALSEGNLLGSCLGCLEDLGAVELGWLEGQAVWGSSLGTDPHWPE